MAEEVREKGRSRRNKGESRGRNTEEIKRKRENDINEGI